MQPPHVTTPTLVVAGSKKIDRRAEINNYLNKAEAVFMFDDEKDVPLREALIILLGGGTSQEQVTEGMAKLDYFKHRWVNDYLSRLAAAGFPERREKLHPSLKQYIEEPAEAAAA